MQYSKQKGSRVEFGFKISSFTCSAVIIKTIRTPSKHGLSVGHFLTSSQIENKTAKQLMNLMSFKNHLYLTFVYFERKLRFSHTEIECREIELFNKMFTMKSVLNPVL